MRIRRVSLAVTALLVLAAPLICAEPSWRDATRDVYLDGVLDRGIQVFFESDTHRAALVSPRGDDAFVLDRDAGTLFAVPRSAFRLATDGAGAELDAAAKPDPLGRFQKVDTVAMTFAAGGHVYLIARHQGVSGEIDEAKLWETVPVWKRLSDAYTPETDVVAGLKRIAAPVRLTAVFGTWCGDSKEFVPRLVKAVHDAGNPKVSLRLVALDLDFRRPADVIQGRRIINVPTILVDRADGTEIGRFTETPAGDSIESDVLAIVNGSPRPHLGRYERGPEIARGTYVYRDGSGAEQGRERWFLYAGKEGGRIVHSTIESGDRTTEVFQGSADDGRLKFAEITRRQGEGVMRARYWLDGDTLTGSLRGREAGILKQDLVVPPSFAFASPAIAAAALATPVAPSPDASSDVVCYVAPETFASPMGSTCVVTYRTAGSETVRVPAGEFRATHIARQSANEASDWWFHPDLNVPVRGQILGGAEYVLASLEVGKK
jgi:hypothetical protein